MGNPNFTRAISVFLEKHNRIGINSRKIINMFMRSCRKSNSQNYPADWTDSKMIKINLVPIQNVLQANQNKP